MTEKIQWLLVGVIAVLIVFLGAFSLRQNKQLNELATSVTSLSAHVRSLSMNRAAQQNQEPMNATSTPSTTSPPRASSVREVCGDFPIGVDGGGPTSRYHVCMNTQDQTCYLRKTYQKQRAGCNPNFSDKNPYGDDSCFDVLTDTYTMQGRVIKTEVADFRSEDSCEPTTEAFIEAKTR